MRLGARRTFVTNLSTEYAVITGNHVSYYIEDGISYRINAKRIQRRISSKNKSKMKPGEFAIVASFGKRPALGNFLENEALQIIIL